MGSNPRNIYCPVDIFTFICWKIVMFVWKDENKWKRGQGWPILAVSKMFLELPLGYHLAQVDDSLSHFLTSSFLLYPPLSHSIFHTQNYVHLLTLSLFNSLAFFLYVLISFLISVLVSFHLSLLMPFLSIITCVCLSISTCVFPFYLYLCFSFSLLPFSTYLSVYLRFCHSLILFTYTSLSLCPMWVYL